MKIMSTSDAELQRLLPMKKSPGKWAREDLVQKKEILQVLYIKMNKLVSDDKEGLIGFLAACLGKESSKEKISALFDKAATRKCSAHEFERFFKSLKPLDAKLIPFNCTALGIKPWPNSRTQCFPENAQLLLEQYVSDSAIPAAVSIRNIESQSIDIASSDVYPIHSVAKVFTGVLTLLMMHEKPDGEHSILPVTNLDLPIKAQLSSEAWELLSPAAQHHLESNNITLRQLMTHHSGLGDYGYDSGKGRYRDTLEADGGEMPIISEIADFLPFAEETIYPAGTFHYSNLGITLVGLVIENAYKTYQETHAELSLTPLNFFGILKNFVLDRAHMTDFFERAPLDPEHTVQTNPADKAALGWVGGPAGGYWTTTDDLVKFGQWLYIKCNDPTFRALVEEHGEEFYRDGQISHPGNSPHASAFFFVDLETGNTGAIGSTDTSGVSLGLELSLGSRVFTAEKTLTAKASTSAILSETTPRPSKETPVPIATVDPAVTTRYKDRIREISTPALDYMAPTDSSKAKEREKYTPLVTTPKLPWK